MDSASSILGIHQYKQRPEDTTTCKAATSANATTTVIAITATSAASTATTSVLRPEQTNIGVGVVAKTGQASRTNAVHFQEEELLGLNCLRRFLIHDTTPIMTVACIFRINGRMEQRTFPIYQSAIFSGDL